jgi:GT2 family glycosyltransferase
LKLSVCISTKNRADELATCLRSLEALNGLDYEVVVTDDGSETPVEPLAREAAGRLQAPLRIVRNETSGGYIPARNAMARLAQGEYVLSLDDDAALLDGEAVRQALAVLDRDPAVGAVALAQVGPDGQPLPASNQPAPVDHACYVPCYYGYGHLLRRGPFVELGGYRELFWFYGEEVEYCKRLLDRGYRVVYLPAARVVHNHSPQGRSELTRMRYGIRNRCLDAFYNEPLSMLLASVPKRIWEYLRHRKVVCRHYQISDAGGPRWLLGELARNVPRVWRERRPLKWATFRAWRELRKTWPRYPEPRPAAAASLAGLD